MPPCHYIVLTPPLCGTCCCCLLTLFSLLLHCSSPPNCADVSLLHSWWAIWLIFTLLTSSSLHWRLLLYDSLATNWFTCSSYLYSLRIEEVLSNQCHYQICWYQLSLMLSLLYLILLGVILELFFLRMNIISSTQHSQLMPTSHVFSSFSSIQTIYYSKSRVIDFDISSFMIGNP